MNQSPCSVKGMFVLASLCRHHVYGQNGVWAESDTNYKEDKTDYKGQLIVVFGLFNGICHTALSACICHLSKRHPQHLFFHFIQLFLYSHLLTFHMTLIKKTASSHPSVPIAQSLLFPFAAFFLVSQFTCWCKVFI